MEPTIKLERDNIRFNVKERTRRFVPSKGKNLVVLYPGTNVMGTLLLDGTVSCDYCKYPGKYHFKMSEVIITHYL